MTSTSRGGVNRTPERKSVARADAVRYNASTMRRHLAPWLLAVLGCWLVASPIVNAEETSPAPTVCPICRRANNRQAPYAEKAGSTLARGAINAAFGWTELLAQPTDEVNNGGNLAVGIGKGMGYAIKRTALGFGELLTFWTPKGRDGNFALAQDCPICSQHKPSPPEKKSP